MSMPRCKRRAGSLTKEVTKKTKVNILQKTDEEPISFALNTRIAAKHSDEFLHFGRVVSVPCCEEISSQSSLWTVEFDDGTNSRKDLSWKEVKEGVRLFQSMISKHGSKIDASVYLHQRVAMYFNGRLYFGVINDVLPNENARSIDEILWTVEFDDGDSSDWCFHEVEIGINNALQLAPSTELSIWEIYDIDSKDRSFAKGLPKIFSKSTVVKFFLFLLERQRCWIRRNFHKDSPDLWTNEPSLRQYFFCNNYRQLDRGTAFFKAQILLNWEEFKATDPDGAWEDWFVCVLWSSYCYRLANRIESFTTNKTTSRSIPKIEEWPKFQNYVLKIKRQAQTNRDAPSFFTGAHQTCGFKSYLLWMNQVYKNQEWLREVAARAGTLESCFHAIRTLPGCGDFLAWQILCDLLESNCLRHCQTIDFCVLGKGAKAGIMEVFYPRNKNKKLCGKEYLSHVKELVKYQDKVFKQLKSSVNNKLQTLHDQYDCPYQQMTLEFPKWRNQSLTIKEMEHALCEFSKFQRIEKCVLKGQLAKGHRLRKSRSRKDEHIICYVCSAPDTKHSLIVCNTCNLSYCSKCFRSKNEGTETTICDRCLELETFQWKEALNVG